MNLQTTKRLFLKMLIGCLIAAALLAVVTVLIGKFNDVCAKALITILLIALHSLVSFGFIANNEKQETFDSLTFFTNATFMIIILSFITSVFGVWGILSGDLVFKLYSLYLVLLFATLHGEVLTKTLGKQTNIDNVVYTNYCFMAVVVVMLLPIIFVGDSTHLGPFYYRLLAACGIIDATLTLVAVIMHKLYVQKHPTITDAVFNVQQTTGLAVGQNVPTAAMPPAKRHMNIFVIILIGFVSLQLLSGLFLIVMGRINQ